MSTRPSNDALDDLVALCHHRWTLPLLAAIGDGARFAVLQTRLGVARETLKRALATASDLDLIEKNPGYGHPLRPEYLPTAYGGSLRRAATKVLETAGTRHAETLGRKWSLPVLVAIAQGSGNFSAIHAALPSATPRALSAALERLREERLVQRHLIDESPPRPLYRLLAAGHRIATAAMPLR